MQPLLAISALFLLVLLLTGVALVRDIRSTRKRVRRLPRQSPRQRPDFAQHLVSAAEARIAATSRVVPAQTLKQVMANKSWNLPPEIITVGPDREMPHPEVQVANRQRAPQAATARHKRLRPPRPTGSERAHWAYFNQVSSDLTDPSQTSPMRANSRNKAPSHKHF